ncbi:hypothetical protein V8F20_000009 [Naviculisporaceae sp. PSN 640]
MSLLLQLYINHQNHTISEMVFSSEAGFLGSQAPRPERRLPLSTTSARPANILEHKILFSFVSMSSFFFTSSPTFGTLLFMDRCQCVAIRALTIFLGGHYVHFRGPQSGSDFLCPLFFSLA